MHSVMTSGKCAPSMADPMGLVAKACIVGLIFSKHLAIVR